MTEAVPTYRQRGRAESFGSVAAEYDRLRPSYPSALIDDLAALGEDVLDVGCGTGKAARLLAARGLNVLGVEIDPEMAAVARAHGITVEVSGFEAWQDAGRRFDLITCAQAWHWIEPEAGLAKAVSVLRQRGTLVPFWNYAELDLNVQEAMREVYARLEPSLLQSVTFAGVQGRRLDITDWSTDPRLAAVELRTYPWERRYDTTEWLELIQTHSDHLQLEPAHRAEVVHAVGAAIDELGGDVAAHYTTYAVFARMAS
ncbi:MAG TPA: class I SAM-dependent methyltransferase [Jatrophihabitans sp.]